MFASSREIPLDARVLELVPRGLIIVAVYSTGAVLVFNWDPSFVPLTWLLLIAPMGCLCLTPMMALIEHVTSRARGHYREHFDFCRGT